MSAQVILGPTALGKSYLIHAKHRDGTPGASQWLRAITPAMEFDLFQTAENAPWIDGKGNYWSIRADRSPVGTLDEYIAKHPCTTNKVDPWHGYPASPARKGDGDCPDDAVIDHWLDSKIINKSFSRRLKKRQI